MSRVMDGAMAGLQHEHRQTLTTLDTGCCGGALYIESVGDKPTRESAAVFYVLN